MGKKTLTNAHCLLELIERAQADLLKTFSGLPECQALAHGFDWSQDEAGLPQALIEHIKHLRKEQRDPAEREALRVLRLSSPRGADILRTVAGQLYDDELIAQFLSQDGGEIGRSIWMRTFSDESTRLFGVAESILNTGDLRGNPCTPAQAWTSRTSSPRYPDCSNARPAPWMASHWPSSVSISTVSRTRAS